MVAATKLIVADNLTRVAPRELPLSSLTGQRVFIFPEESPMTASPVAFRTTPRSQYTPSFEDVARLFEQGDLVPVYRSLPADLETPVSVYLKLAQANEPSFLLESVEGGENVARFSFLGVAPASVLIAQGDQVSEELGGKTTTTKLEPGQDALHVIKATLSRFNPVPLPNLPRFV